MGYDLAVWEGERPSDDDATGATFEELYARYIESGVGEPPTERIRAYVEALLARYPEDDRSPWSTAPLIGEAIGPFMYFPMVYSRCEEVSAWAAQLAADHGLICFDPQMGRLRPVPAHIRLSSLRTIGGPKAKFHGPPEPEAMAGQVRAALQRGSYAILESGPGRYVQAGSGKGTGMGKRPGYAVEYRDGLRSVDDLRNQTTRSGTYDFLLQKIGK